MSFTGKGTHDYGMTLLEHLGFGYSPATTITKICLYPVLRVLDRSLKDVSDKWLKRSAILTSGILVLLLSGSRQIRTFSKAVAKVGAFLMAIVGLVISVGLL